jgi:2-dehydro-3-deoxyphosphogalactonate aldolase
MNTPSAKFQTAMNDLPLVAILRGLTPAEAPIIGDALVEIGFRLLQVPLNSPQPLESIALLRARFPQALVGAGTVLSAQDVREVAAVGGQLIVAPNFNLEVAAEATRPQLVSLPGVMTPTEAFGAMEAGATGLKLFPAEMASPSVVKTLLAVLPPGTKLIPVGGISAGNIPRGVPPARPASVSGRPCFVREMTCRQCSVRRRRWWPPTGLGHPPNAVM